MDNRPIGFLDSGVGGLTVVRELMRQLPHEEIVYIGDSARAPYGPRPAEQIREYTWQLVNFLLTKDVKMIVIACNTATSAAVALMRKKYDIPIIGMEPAVKKAVDLYGNQKVLVCATPITVKGKKMLDLVERVDKDHLVDLVALPKLVRFAEKQEFNSDEVLAYLKEALSKFDFKEYGSLVLGCTHFNYFKDSFHQLLPHVHLLDGNRGTINYLMKNIELENLESSVEYYYSAKRVSGEELKRIERYLERLKNMKDIGI